MSSGLVLGPGHLVDDDGVEWVTTAAAARLLAVSPAAVRQWSVRNRHRYRRLAGRVAWHRLDALQDVEKRTRPRRERSKLA